MKKISGVILTKNNEKTIREVILSIKDLISELIIVDDYSTDNTVKIIKKEYPKAKIVKRKLDSFSNQRNYGIELAKNSWVLMIDSDEVVSDKLREEIIKVMGNPRYEAYNCLLTSFILCKKFWTVKMDRPILFKRKYRWTGIVHEKLVYPKKEEWGFLNGEAYHISWRGVENLITKLNSRSTKDVEKWVNERRDYGRIQIFLMATIMPIKMFIHWYIKMKGFKKGLAGFLYALLSASIWIFKAIKYYERKYVCKSTNF